jgi:hypothetical protein
MTYQISQLNYDGIYKNAYWVDAVIDVTTMECAYGAHFVGPDAKQLAEEWAAFKELQECRHEEFDGPWTNGDGVTQRFNCKKCGVARFSPMEG